MKIKHIIVFIAVTLLMGCGKSESTMKQEELFPKGERLPKEWFTGEAFQASHLSLVREQEL